MPAEHSLFGEMNGNLLGNSNVRKEHELCNVVCSVLIQPHKGKEPYLFNQVVSLGPLILTTIGRQTTLIQRKREAKRVGLDTTSLEAARTELLG